MVNGWQYGLILRTIMTKDECYEPYYLQQAVQILNHICTSSIWFCRNPGLALPLIALNITKSNLMLNLLLHAAGTTTRCCVFCDYIFLDTDERRRFAQVSHEYLIEQLQFSNNISFYFSGATATAQAELRFNRPVKELMWVITDTVTSATVAADDCLYSLMAMTDSREEQVHTSQQFKDINIIQAMEPTNLLQMLQLTTYVLICS